MTKCQRFGYVNGDTVLTYRGYEIVPLPAYAPDGFSYQQVKIDGEEDGCCGWQRSIFACLDVIDERQDAAEKLAQSLGHTDR